MAQTIVYLGIIFVAIMVLFAYIICRLKGKNCIKQLLPKGRSITLTYDDASGKN